MIELLLAILLACLLWCVAARPVRSSLNLTMEWLEDLKRAALDPNGPWAFLQSEATHRAAENIADIAIIAMLASAETLSGRPIGSPIRVLATQIAQANYFAKLCRELILNLCFKTWIISAIALAGRRAVMWYISLGPTTTSDPEDSGFVLIAMLGAVLAVGLLRTLMPKPWLGASCLSPIGKTWTSLRFNGDANMPAGWRFDVWNRIRDKEIYCGFDLLPEREELLDDWTRALTLDQELALRRWDSFFPLIELALIGGLATAILLHPVLIVCYR